MYNFLVVMIYSYFKVENLRFREVKLFFQDNRSSKSQREDPNPYFQLPSVVLSDIIAVT